MLVLPKVFLVGRCYAAVETAGLLWWSGRFLNKLPGSPSVSLWKLSLHQPPHPAPACCQNSLNFLWHRFYKMLETSPLSISSMLTWLHRIVSADLSAILSCCENLRRSAVGEMLKLAHLASTLTSRPQSSRPPPPPILMFDVDINWSPPTCVCRILCLVLLLVHCATGWVREWAGECFCMINSGQRENYRSN